MFFQKEQIEFIYAELSPTRFLVKLFTSDALIAVGPHAVQSTKALSKFKKAQTVHKEKCSALHKQLGSVEKNINALNEELCEESDISYDGSRLAYLQVKRGIIDQMEEYVRKKYSLWKTVFTGTLIIKSKCANADLKELHRNEYDKPTDYKITSFEELAEDIPDFVDYFLN